MNTQTALEIAEQFATIWYADEKDTEEKELRIRGLARNLNTALVAYSNAKLEQAAQRLEQEMIEYPVSRHDQSENEILERAQVIVRAMKGEET